MTAPDDVPAWRRLLRAVRGRLPVRPRAYWASRHDVLAGSLRAPGHADLTEEQNARDYEVKRARLVEAVAPFAPAPGERRRLLDAGCGTGLMFPAWRGLGFEVEGMDFASPEARQGRGPGGEPIVLGDITRLPAEPPRDVIACVDVLFHVLSDASWRRFLRSAALALAPGGRLVVQEALVAPDAYRGVQAHCHFRRLDDYRSAARDAGLRLESHVRYELPHEATPKDVLVFAREDGTAP